MPKAHTIELPETATPQTAQVSLEHACRLAAAIFCECADSQRTDQRIMELVRELVGEDRELGKGTLERWRRDGVVLPRQSEAWSERPWRLLLLDYQQGKVTLDDILGPYSYQAQDMLQLVYGEDVHQDAVLRAMPRTKAQWLRWLEIGLGPATRGGVLKLMDAALTEGNTCPFEWTWLLWCLANGRSSDDLWTKLTPREISQGRRKVLLHGSRGSMKTMGLAAVIFSLCWFIPKYSACHCAAQKDQASACLEYLQGWSDDPRFHPQIGTSLKTRIEFSNGSILFLITATEKGLNSDHTLWFSADEVELMLYKVLLEGLRIPQGIAGWDLPAVTVLASSQKRNGMTMELLIEKAENGEYAYYRWNWFDVVQHCDDWRTENLPVDLQCSDYPEIAAYLTHHERDHHELKGIDRLVYERMVKKREQLEANCKVVKYCEGRAKSGAGHYLIDDIVEALNDSVEQFEAQGMCQRPSPVGAVYPKFDKGNVSDLAVWRPGLRTVGAADYGFACDPAAGNLYCADEKHWNGFLEVHEEGIQAKQQAAIYHTLTRRYGVEVWFVDGSAKELIMDMRRLGLVVVPIKRRLSSGIDKLSSMILNGMGHRTLRLHPSLVHTLREMRAYQLSDTTKQPKHNQEDHHCDNNRYFAEGVTSKQSLGARIREAKLMGRSLSRKSSALERIR